MDKIDRYILSELLKDCQTPFSRIAKQLGVTPATVGERYKKMCKRGVIQRCSIVIDFRKAGYETTLFIFIKCKTLQGRAEIIDFLQKIPNVVGIIEIIGDYNVFANIAIKDLQGLIKTLNKIQNHPAVALVDFDLITEVFPHPHHFDFTLPELIKYK
jgi:DNA-binding Lrp family transcriptional regulator